MRPSVQRLEPYVWEISSEEVAARYGVPLESVLRFDTNTSPFVPSVALPANLTLNEYPDTSYRELVEEITRYTGFPAEQIVVGCGADEVLDMLTKVFLEPGSRAVLTRPSYGMYGVLTEMAGAEPLVVPDRPGFERDVDGIITAARDASLVWLCNANNPTANLMPLADLERLAERVPCALVVDEAYFEFTGVTAAGLIARYPHVVVVRTLSKAFALAGLRVGYALCSPELAEVLNRVRPPNSVGALPVAIGAAALRDLDGMRERVRLVLAEKERFAALLAPLVEEVYPSATNFLLIRARDARRAVDSLLRAGLVVRDLSTKAGLTGCLRPTVRLPEENDRFVEALVRAQ